jgi:transposase
VVRDRFSAYKHLPLKQRQVCWTHLIRDLIAIAERPGACTEFGADLLGLQQKLFGHWHHYKDGTIDWPALQQRCRLIRKAFEATLQRVVALGAQRGERTP